MEQEYYRDYEKLYSRVFPVYDRPKAQATYDRDMTLRVLRRTFKNDPDAPQPTLTLFPEGGNLVAGVPNRVAFEAVMSDGQWLEGSLKASPLTLLRLASHLPVLRERCRWGALTEAAACLPSCRSGGWSGR